MKGFLAIAIACMHAVACSGSNANGVADGASPPEDSGTLDDASTQARRAVSAADSRDGGVQAQDVAQDAGVDADAPEDAGVIEASTSDGSLALGCGPGMRYALQSGHGIIIDNQTGLVWDGPSRYASPPYDAWKNVMNWCQQEGGRLGTRAELLSIAGDNFALCAWPSGSWFSWSSELTTDGGAAYAVRSTGEVLALKTTMSWAGICVVRSLRANP